MRVVTAKPAKSSGQALMVPLVDHAQLGIWVYTERRGQMHDGSVFFQVAARHSLVFLVDTADFFGRALMRVQSRHGEQSGTAHSRCRAILGHDKQNARGGRGQRVNVSGGGPWDDETNAAERFARPTRLCAGFAWGRPGAWRAVFTTTQHSSTSTRPRPSPPSQTVDTNSRPLCALLRILSPVALPIAAALTPLASFASTRAPLVPLLAIEACSWPLHPRNCDRDPRPRDAQAAPRPSMENYQKMEKIGEGKCSCCDIAGPTPPQGAWSRSDASPH